MNVIEPQYAQADLERAYRQGLRAGIRTAQGRAQAALQALGDDLEASVDTAPIPNNLRATVARMARVGRQLPVRPDQRLPRGEEGTLGKERPARPFVSPSPLARPLSKSYTAAEFDAHMDRAWEGPARRNLAPEDPTVHVNQECSPRPDLTLVQEEHGTKRLPRV